MSSNSSWLIRTIARSPGRGEVPQQDGELELTQNCRVVKEQGCSSSSPPVALGQSQPVAIAQQQHPNLSVARCGSSGNGLPSALGTPPSPTGPISQHPIPHASQSEQQPGSPPEQPGATSFSKKGVRWLPGLHVPTVQGSRPPIGVGSSAKALAAPTADSGAQSGPGQPGTGAVGDALPGGTTGEPGLGGSSSSRSHAGALPACDDQQLGNYLRYLLQEQHPHKFMYYPGWGLSEASCAAVGEFLRRDKRIKVVTLSGNSITDDGLELIAEGLAHNSSLLSLDLSNNAISSVGAIELAEALHSSKCRVTELLLSNNHIGDEGADALAAAVASSSSLKKLNLSGNPISTAQLEVVQHVLKTREYKLSAQRRSTKSSKHMRKSSSSLQFDIELIEGQSRSSSSTNVLARKDVLRLPPAMAVAALIEPKDPLESSIGTQAAHLLAELHEKAKQRTPSPTKLPPDPDSSSGVSEAAAAAVAPAAAPSSLNNSLAVMLALRLACRGYDVVLRTCLPSLDDAGKEGLPGGHQAAAPELLSGGLRHTFVRVSQPVPADEAVVLPTVIVDPLFKEQFLMPHATDRFRGALDALPRVLCLAEARLWHLVELLCSESAAAFKEADLSLPPWRSTSAVMDKWLSGRFQDVVVDADSSLEKLKQAVESVTIS